jgi:hypothetical protein
MSPLIPTITAADEHKRRLRLRYPADAGMRNIRNKSDDVLGGLELLFVEVRAGGSVAPMLPGVRYESARLFEGRLGLPWTESRIIRYFDAHQPGDLLMHLEGCEQCSDVQRNA